MRCVSIFSSTTPASRAWATSAPVSCVEPSTKRNAIDRPSRDQRGSSSWPCTFVSCRGEPPPAGATQICIWPGAAASDKKAIHFPSGEKTGLFSTRISPLEAAVSGRDAPEAISITRIAPSRSWPSASRTFSDQATRAPSSEIAAEWNPRTFDRESKTSPTEGDADALGSARSAVRTSADETIIAS
jgi:hypothetical protein